MTRQLLVDLRGPIPVDNLHLLVEEELKKHGLDRSTPIALVPEIGDECRDVTVKVYAVFEPM